MTSPKVIDNRKRLIINPKFQLQFLLLGLLPLFTILVIFMITRSYIYNHEIEMGRAWGLDENHPYFALLEYHQGLESQILILSIIVIAVVILLWTLLMSHRIAGPIYRLTRYFEDGKLSDKVNPISFRPGDFFPEVPETVNNFMQAKGLLVKKKEVE